MSSRMASSASAGPRRELRRRGRDGYCVYDPLRVDTVAQMVPGGDEDVVIRSQLYTHPR